MRYAPAARLTLTILSIIQLAFISEGAVPVEHLHTDPVYEYVSAVSILLLDVKHIDDKASISPY